MSTVSRILGAARQSLLAMLAMLAATVDGQTRVNPFGDPFVQATAAMADCPSASPPRYSEQEIQGLAHERSQRGVSCWLSGRCRLHNAYLYDAEIVPRVRQAIRYDGRFADTSVWVLGQRRHVWLKGCVRTPEQIEQLERLASRIDDVERVQTELMVGTAGLPPYEVLPPLRGEAHRSPNADAAASSSRGLAREAN